MVPQTAQIPGSTLGGIFGFDTTITMPSGVCMIGAGPNASYYDSQNGAVAFDFPAGTVNSCLVNMAVELDETDTNGIAIRFEGSSSGKRVTIKLSILPAITILPTAFPREKRASTSMLPIPEESAQESGITFSRTLPFKTLPSHCIFWWFLRFSCLR